MAYDYKIFYASDIHGSEKCFMKFINSAKFYKANAIILGGDLTGKLVVPLIKSNTTYRGHFLGRDFVAETGLELEQVMKLARLNGFYPAVMEHDEYEEIFSDDQKRQELMDGLVLESINKWIDIAESRLKNTSVRCFINAGNDDDEFVDKALRNSVYVENCDDDVVDLDEDHQMLTFGWSNRTPFNSPREMDEDDIEKRIRSAAKKINNLSASIFTLHVPPFASGLDLAPKLINLEVVASGGHTVLSPIGSTAVRTIIEEMQPMLGLHGHVHESRGTKMIGKTVCINPGSEYSEGVLRGAVITLGSKKIKGYQLVQA